jgi:phosphoglycerol transferase MdoB-like AlkP superfamily enzyme
MEMNTNYLVVRILPLLIGFALLLSISTNLRLEAFPVGPGELSLAAISVFGFVFGDFWRQRKTPIFLFWFLVLSAMAIGSMVGPLKGHLTRHHAMAYIFTAAISVGLSLLIAKLKDEALRGMLFWLCLLTACFLWFGFLVYLLDDISLAQILKMANASDTRYTGWSTNANQLALFFVPLPVWGAALWRDIAKPLDCK